MKAHSLEDELRGLMALDLIGLRQVWQVRFGPPPALRSLPILRLMLAWRLQAKVLGGLEAAARKSLSRKQSGSSHPSHGPGTVLRRSWRGRQIEVIIEHEGYRFEGKIYGSLSAIAELVTGTRWNGPRFFGLRPS